MLGSLAPERAALATAAGLALLAALSCGVARLGAPLAGLGVGVGLLLAVPLAGAARTILRRAREPGALRARAVLPVALGMILAVLGLLVSTTVVFDRPLPALAWAGFGVVVLVVLALAVAVLALLTLDDAESHREASRGRTRSRDHRYRLLLVADATCDATACRSLAERLEGRPGTVCVVAPALTSPLRHWASDEDGAREEARRRLDLVLGELAALGIEARGEVGDEDPLQAVDDQLRTFPADEIVLAVHPESSSTWLEEGVVERARRLYDLPVSRVTVG